MHQEKDNQQLQNEIFTRNQKIEILDTECKKLRETIIESARNLNQQHAEEIHQLQEKITTSNEHRQQENDKSRNTISALQKQIDQIVLEKQSMHNDKV